MPVETTDLISRLKLSDCVRSKYRLCVVPLGLHEGNEAIVGWAGVALGVIEL